MRKALAIALMVVFAGASLAVSETTTTSGEHPKTIKTQTKQKTKKGHHKGGKKSKKGSGGTTTPPPK